jgi:hypothetical protein
MERAVYRSISLISRYKNISFREFERSLIIALKDIILDGLYLNCIRLVKEHFEKNLKIEFKQTIIYDIGLRSVLQLLADKDLRGAETLLNHMVG